jgi:hypothetical protein
MPELMDHDAHEKEWMKKYRDVDKKGITSIYWPEVLQIIKFLEKREDYEKCQELWDYYVEVTGEKK